MHNIDAMHRMQSPNGLNQYLPNLPLLDIGSFFFVLFDFLVNITVITVLHYNAKLNKVV